ncbi:MAG TPA: phosphate ABC transporter permease PstA [Candidatus Polarisedimenticolaceae bacterium]|nr:phosphate ABC transporter permease PstA [Candidatus Polarisedimenticolaceae bacterium]
MKTVRNRPSDLPGRALTWLTGGTLALNLLLIAGLLTLLAVHGGSAFWPQPLWLVTLKDGTKLLGEVAREEETRIQLRVANRDLTGADFRWVDTSEIAARMQPTQATLLERLEWGNFQGFPVSLKRGDTTVADGPEAVWSALPPLLAVKHREAATLKDLEKSEIGSVNRELEALRLTRKRTTGEAELSSLDRQSAALQAKYEALVADLEARRSTLLTDTLVMRDASGTMKDISVGGIVRAVRPNGMGGGEKLGLYLARVREFLLDDPRESNTEGGIFPAIFGTVMMVFLMSFAVMPFGVLAALYLREYARQGPFVRAVRIAVNNLAGVPSIVFGVFGLGFFVYVVGGSIDRLFFAESLPTPTFGTGGILWAALTLALLTVPVVVVATEEGLAAVPRGVREGAYALGATKLETTWKVVLPAAAPGILTGMILAMARAAGEVAPLMIVGMVKLAPSLPIDGQPPFLHLERKFMHLGFHIYDVGFQSPNVEATKPLVFATALLLIGVITVVNLAAITLRNHLRRRYASSAV